MRKIIVTFILQIFTAAAVFAAVPVKGIVVDAKTGDPVPGAVVRLDKSYLWAVTDAGGSFSFKDVQTGSYDMETTCLGYVTDARKLDVSRSINDLIIKLSVSSLAIDEVVVTAQKSKDNINTTRTLGRNALDHLQASGMSGILSLLPGGKTINPDLTGESYISLRAGGSTQGNAAFGTAIEVNGVRMGGNGDFSGLSGSGTRSVSVENIESVEVMTGVASAEYGDLNSGMVIVQTRKGRTPVNLTFSVNPRTYEVAVSKGYDLGPGCGTLNVNGENTRATKKLTSPYTSYTRRGFGFEYSNTIAKVLRLEAGLTGNIGGMNSKDDPDTFSEEYSTGRDNVLAPHFKAVWLLNKSWITNISLDGSIYYHDERAVNHTYNSYSTSQPAVHSEQQGYWFATQLPLTFYSDQVIDSEELDYAASLKYDWLRHWGRTKNTLKAGVQWKANGNNGQGESYKNPALAANGFRPRPYTDYPYMHNLSVYLEDNLKFPVGSTNVDISAGLRLENVFISGSEYDRLRTLSPRLNARWNFTDNISLRGGWGIMQKLPSFYILYPRQEYRDIQTFGFSRGNAGDASYVYYTIPYAVQHNPDLKWQSSENAEIGLDIAAGGFKISLAGWRNVTHNPYMFSNIYNPFTYNVMNIPSGMAADVQLKLDHQTGYVYYRGSDDEYWTPTDFKVADRTFVASRMQDNGDDVVRAGIELTADFPEIRAIRTSFRLDAAYTYTRYADQTPYAYYQTGWSHTSLPNRSYQYAGIYAGTNSVANGKRTDNLDANLTAITHIPAARLIITCRLEASLIRRSRNLSVYNGRDYAFTVSETSNTPTGGNIYEGNSYTAIYPIAYIDLDGNVKDFTSAEAADPEFARLIMKSGNAYTFAKDGYDPYMFANISITKEIGDHVSVSFFANNFTNSRKFVKSYATGVSAIFTPDFYYGLTCRLKF